jgi:DNA repair protein RecO (recombination protein O)
LILKGTEFRETSRIVTAYTRDHGKLRLVARGALRPTSRFGGALESFTHAGIIFYRRESRDLYALSEAVILDSFEGLVHDAVRLGVAGAGVELLDRTTPWEAENRRLFELLLGYLRVISGVPRAGFRSVFLSFALKLSSLLGYGPELAVCVRCHRGIRDGDPGSFNVRRGGVVCFSCQGGEGNAPRLSPGAIRALRVLQSLPLPAVTLEALQATDVREAAPLIKSFLEHHTEGQGPRHSFSFLAQLEPRPQDDQSL